MRDVSRLDDGTRIVGEFSVGWTVAVADTVQVEGRDDAGRTALRRARERLAGTPVERVEWEAPKVEVVG